MKRIRVLSHKADVVLSLTKWKAAGKALIFYKNYNNFPLMHFENIRVRLKENERNFKILNSVSI